MVSDKIQNGAWRGFALTKCFFLVTIVVVVSATKEMSYDTETIAETVAATVALK